MPNLGPTELIIILVVVVLLFGAKKLPELGSSVGKSIRNFKKGVSEAKDEDGNPIAASGATGATSAKAAAADATTTADER